LRAFREVGVAGEVIGHGYPFDHLRLLNADGSLIADLPTPHTGGDDLPSTLGSLRASMQDVLCKAVYQAGVAVRLGLTVSELAQLGERVEVRFSDRSRGEFDLVVGADGIRSHTRRLLGIDVDPAPVGMTIWRIVSRRPEAMRCADVYYGGPHYKAGYSPISAEQCYAYLLDEDLHPSAFGDRPLGAVLRERSAGYGGLWGEVRETITDATPVDFRRIEYLLVPDPWYRGRAIVVGDAAHACPPLIAQGAAMCAEDATVLAELVTGDAPVEEALAEFMRRRMPRVRMVVENSLRLAEWEIHPGTPGADPGGVMTRTLSALVSPP
jgi:2-polyprenyl-6-methoxyphenol hydroxylase-like FAD-dependent oxidoreductase